MALDPRLHGGTVGVRRRLALATIVTPGLTRGPASLPRPEEEEAGPRIKSGVTGGGRAGRYSAAFASASISGNPAVRGVSPGSGA